MAKIAPPFYCPQCGKELTYTYDANTGFYVPKLCREPDCSEPKLNKSRRS